MRNRLFAVLAIAVLAGGGLAYGTYNAMKPPAVINQAVPTQPVVVAATDLSLGAELKPEDLKVLNFPQGQAPEGTFAAAPEIVGRGLIVSVVKGEPILPGKLAAKEAGSGLPPVIPDGMRAVSVRVNEVIGVAGYVLPGSRVDVITTVSPTNQMQDMTSKVVLANVLTLTAGTRMEQDQKDGKPVQVTVVTLAVSPEQAERLALASTEGKIQLALRNPMDSGAPITPGIRTAGLLGGKPAEAPRQVARSTQPRRVQEPQTAIAPAPVVAPSVEIIRGDKRSTEVIK